MRHVCVTGVISLVMHVYIWRFESLFGRMALGLFLALIWLPVVLQVVGILSYHMTCDCAIGIAGSSSGCGSGM